MLFIFFDAYRILPKFDSYNGELEDTIIRNRMQTQMKLGYFFKKID
jgi:hypothetical protein